MIRPGCGMTTLRAVANFWKSVQPSIRQPTFEISRASEKALVDIKAAIARLAAHYQPPPFLPSSFVTPTARAASLLLNSSLLRLPLRS